MTIVTVTPERAAARRSGSLKWWLILFAVWGLSAVYTASGLNRGWVPHDEGSLAQGAERVLGGELPHRDFEELYTGGLTYLNALAFRALGINLRSLRVVLYVFFLAWVPVVFYVASRFTSALAAGAVTLLAVAWSVPIYAAAMPSWYNLFFAVFGIAALFHYLETDRYSWLFLVGISGGLSFLAKVSGLYYIAAVLLFLVFREQCLAHTEFLRTQKRGRVYPIFVRTILMVFVMLLIRLIATSGVPIDIIYFVLPGAALAVLLILRESNGIPGSDRKRFKTLLRMLVPVLVGAILPVAIFLTRYVLAGSLTAFFHGVFILAGKRLSFASMEPPGLVAMAAALPWAVLLHTPARQRKSVPMFIRLSAVLGLSAVLLFAAKYPAAYRFTWFSVATLIPLTVLMGGAQLLKTSNSPDALSVGRQQRIMLLLCMVAICSLVQYPFAQPVYFCYVAPLLALAVLALLSSREGRSPFLMGSLISFYLLFAVLLMPRFLWPMARYYAPDEQPKPLTLARAGGLRVDPRLASVYEHLIPIVREHSGGGFMYAAPDCPEVYFLSGLRNPTPILFDFFDEPAGRTARILSALETHHVKVVAILTQPPFSGPLEPDLKAALTERFPDSTLLGRFEVRWRP